MSQSQRIDQALTDPKLQLAVYSATGRMAERRRSAVTALSDYQELRQYAQDVKAHTLNHLDFYLEQLEQNVFAHGGKVIWAEDASDACNFIRDLARGRNTKLIVKSKSMTTEEIHLNAAVEKDGVEIVETDLGEYIIQLAGETPFHIIAPALHKTREDVADIFEKRLHSARETDPEKLTAIARVALREKFLAAGIGITGANFLIADSGAVVVVENEGNARLSSSAPKVHVAVAGIEKVIPRAQDLAVFLKLLARSATGQELTVYTSFLSGPARPGEPDGPDEFYLVLLDNGRSKVLEDAEKRETLSCIRCGACLNHCPVYRKIGGHSYPGVYSGPIGKILTPQIRGVEEDSWLPFASSLCGACAEVCPVKINIPGILLKLRQQIAKDSRNQGGWLERTSFRIFAWVMRHPNVYECLGRFRGIASKMKIGPLKAWASERDLTRLPEKSFRELWRARKKHP